MSDGSTVKISRGLKDVHFDRSGLADIDGRAGELRYRGYSIDDLARHSAGSVRAHLRHRPGAGLDPRRCWSSSTTTS